MYTPQAREYDDPCYGTGHADYSHEKGVNECCYPSEPTITSYPADRRAIEKARTECLEAERAEISRAMHGLAMFTGYRKVAFHFASVLQGPAKL